MELGYRIIRPEDVGTQPLDFVQISLWRAANWGVAEGEQSVREAIEMAATCKARGIRTVFHPLDYPLTGENASHTLTVMRRLADAADLGIIIHDEGNTGGKRLANNEADQYARNVKEISGLCRVSIENSYNSGDITWFWERFAAPASVNTSITLDIGHLELAGLDSVRFVRNMPQHLVERTEFVHMHHHDAREPHEVKDHRPLVAGCREIEALQELLKRKQDVRVILELDAGDDGMRRSIELLQSSGIRTSS
jgi:sugar phosphate isomerase/epimerase